MLRGRWVRLLQWYDADLDARDHLRAGARIGLAICVLDVGRCTGTLIRPNG